MNHKTAGMAAGGVMGMLLVSLLAVSVFGQVRTSLRGSVTDEMGASIVTAIVTLIDGSGARKTATTNADGTFSFTDLAPGKYKILATASGFGAAELREVEVNAGRPKFLDITLRIAAIESQVKISTDQAVSTDPSNNADQTLITGRDLDALPDDPDELAATLQALAGPANGPNGGQISIDGFSTGNMPRRESIREVRINQNPFSAENDNPGGRIDILTRAGTEKFHGSGSLNFSDESLNSRNPFQINSPKRAPFQVRQIGGIINGPVQKKKSSFYLEFTRNEYDDNELIRATVLGSSLNAVLLGQLAFSPRKFTGIDERTDYAVNPGNNLVLRYIYRRNFLPAAGVAGFSLPERSFRNLFTSHLVQITDTAVLNANAVSEFRFQYSRSQLESLAASSNPTLNVSGSFVGGGSSVGHQLNTTNRWEFQNVTQIQKGNHSIKFGGRVRGVSVKDINPGNFNGLWTFAGGITGLKSLERYRRTLQLQRLNLTPAQIRAAGGGAAQFSIATGNPLATVRQFDLGPFVQDDWRARPNLVLSYGLRYEVQNNASSRMGFAPRLSIAWSPGAVKTGHSPKTVFRAGAGVFYNRFGEASILQTRHIDGLNVEQFIFSESASPLVPTDPFTLSILNSFHCIDGSANPDCVTNLPSLAGANPVMQTIWRVAPALRVPAIYLFGAQVDRQLPHNFAVSVNASMRRIVHAIRIRDVNAPIPETITAANPGGVRPNPILGEINQFEGVGRFHIEQFSVTFNSRVNPHFSLNGNYALSKVMSDTDGQNGGDVAGIPPFPRDSYDVSSEWGPASFDVRQQFSLFGNYANPKLWKLTFAPFIVARSAVPFNITTGIDSNLDRQFSDRPSFASPQADCAAPFIKCTRFGSFNLIPNSGEKIIPRNFARGTPTYMVNLRVSRSFVFGRVHNLSAANKTGATHSDSKYSLSMAVAFQNLLNTVNLAPPIGNLSSPLFGQSQGLTGIGGGGGGNANAGNRRIYLSAQFSF